MPTDLAPVRTFPAPLAALLAGALALAAAGCGREEAPAGAAAEPEQAVAVLVGHLRRNDLQAFAHDAVPPTLQPALAEAWRSGRTRWPLEELPFDHRFPGMLAALSAEDADATLRRGYDRQFANAHEEIRAAAEALSLFGVKYLQSDQTLSAGEREHYVQLVQSLGNWARQARLGDRQRARVAIGRLTQTARRTGLRSEADFRRLGMDESLRRLGPMLAALKDCLRDYALDLDQSLDGMTLSLESRDGDRARVRMRYPLAGRTIDTVVAVERVDGHWYLSDFLRHVRALTAPSPAPSSTPVPPAGQVPPPVAAPATPVTDRPTSS